MLLDAFLPAPSAVEEGRIEGLRSAALELPLIPATDGNVESEWQRNLRTLRYSIATRDPRNFLRWDVVRHTMFHEAHAAEFDHLNGLSTWPKYRAALVESPIGRPRPYSLMASTSGNLVHHAYSYSQLFDAFSLEIGDCHHVFEFGGGYGSFARFTHQMGFSGKYTIFDLPEFSLLQWYFLSSLTSRSLSVARGLNPNPGTAISLVAELAAVQKAADAVPIDVFVATWSISESPLAIRRQIFDRIGSPRYYLIAYQENFNGIDNVSYFQQFAAGRSDYSWDEHGIDHLPGNRYLLGKKCG